MIQRVEDSHHLQGDPATSRPINSGQVRQPSKIDRQLMMFAIRAARHDAQSRASAGGVAMKAAAAAAAAESPSVPPDNAVQTVDEAGVTAGWDGAQTRSGQAAEALAAAVRAAAQAAAAMAGPAGNEEAAAPDEATRANVVVKPADDAEPVGSVAPLEAAASATDVAAAAEQAPVAPAAAGPAAAEQASTEPAATEPAATEPATAEPATAGQEAAEPVPTDGDAPAEGEVSGDAAVFTEGAPAASDEWLAERQTSMEQLRQSYTEARQAEIASWTFPGQAGAETQSAQPEPSRFMVEGGRDESGSTNYVLDEKAFREAWLASQPPALQQLAQLYGLDDPAAMAAQYGDVIDLALRGTNGLRAPDPIDPREARPPEFLAMGDAQMLAEMDAYLGASMNQALILMFGQGPIEPPQSDLAKSQLSLFGRERYDQFQRLEMALKHIQKDYADQLTAAKQSDDKSGPGWYDEAYEFVVSPAWSDESGRGAAAVTETRIRRAFSVEQFSQWYVAQPNASNQAFAALYGVGREAVIPGQEAYFDESGNLVEARTQVVFDVQSGVGQQRELVLRGDRVIDPDLAQINLNDPPRLYNDEAVSWHPLHGWVTPESNIKRSTDWGAMIIGAVLVAVVSVVTYGAASGWAAGAYGALIGGATAGAASAAVSGFINGNFSWDSVLEGFLVGGVTSAATLGMGQLTSTMTETAASATTTAGRIVTGGMISELRGGSFGDGATSSAISMVGQAAGVEINGVAGDLGAGGGLSQGFGVIGEALVEGALTEFTGGDFTEGFVYSAASAGVQAAVPRPAAPQPIFDDDGNLMPGVVDPRWTPEEQRAHVAATLQAQGYNAEEAASVASRTAVPGDAGFELPAIEVSATRDPTPGADLGETSPEDARAAFHASEGERQSETGSRAGVSPHPVLDDEGNLMPGIVDPQLSPAQQRSQIANSLAMQGYSEEEAARISANARLPGELSDPVADQADGHNDVRQDVEGSHSERDAVRYADAFEDRVAAIRRANPELSEEGARQIAEGLEHAPSLDGSSATPTVGDNPPAFADDVSEQTGLDPEGMQSARWRDRSAAEVAAFDDTLVQDCAQSRDQAVCESARTHYGAVQQQVLEERGELQELLSQSSDPQERRRLALEIRDIDQSLEASNARLIGVLEIQQDAGQLTAAEMRALADMRALQNAENGLFEIWAAAGGAVAFRNRGITGWTPPGHRFDGILAPNGKPVGTVRANADPTTRTVTPDTYTSIRNQLLEGATPGDYYAGGTGRWHILPGGGKVGVRSSRGSGETLDIVIPGYPSGYKIHQHISAP